MQISQKTVKKAAYHFLHYKFPTYRLLESIRYVEKKCMGTLIKNEPGQTTNMVTTVIMRCTDCPFFFNISSSKGKVAEIFSWGTINAGTTYAQGHKLLNLCHVDTINEHAYISHKQAFDAIWYQELQIELGKNIEAEIQFAIEHNRFLNGKPAVRVKIDAGFAKKNFGRFDARTSVVSVLKNLK
jgi:hypothetical protein